MNSDPPEPRDVPVEVLPPVPGEPSGETKIMESKPPLAGLKTFYHPASGIAILAIDLLLFGPEALIPWDNVFLCPLAFFVTLPLVYFFQLKWSSDTKGKAFGKAFFGAFLAGLPFSITGTIFGAAVIALSGLPKNPVEAYQKLVESRKLKE
jgi:hypothetical protein